MPQAEEVLNSSKLRLCEILGEEDGDKSLAELIDQVGGAVQERDKLKEAGVPTIIVDMQ